MRGDFVSAAAFSVYRKKIKLREIGSFPWQAMLPSYIQLLGFYCWENDKGI
jgi:hypothetical protein